MNDFTKDELVKIWRCINPVLIGDAAYDLKIKLRNMIDDYCDHETVGDCLDCGTSTCLKCNKRWEDD